MNSKRTSLARRRARRRKSHPFAAITLVVLAAVAISHPFGVKATPRPTSQLLQPPSQTSWVLNGGVSGLVDLVVVNPWNPLPDSYVVNLTQLRNGQAVDERCYPDLQAMMNDCRAAGLSPLICSSYRSQEKQELLYGSKVSELRRQGYSREAAQIEAGKSVAVPGTSEHQLGLAVDIVDESNQRLDHTQEHTPVQQWLMDNSWKYGFILRYPDGKSDITGIIYEPWHYRYVGKEAAREIYEQGVCLEEYLAPEHA